MLWCIVRGCKSNSCEDQNLSFYRIPKVATRFSAEFQLLLQKRREGWLCAAKITEEEAEEKEHGRICSVHFKSGTETLNDMKCTQYCIKRLFNNLQLLLQESLPIFVR